LTVDRLTISSRGRQREYELLSLLRQAGNRLRKVTVRPDAPIAGSTIGDASVWHTYGVTVLAVHHEGNWQFAPGGSVPIGAGEELFVVGPSGAIRAFREAVA
jgi:K+/H+ antiporter YhaU regulatory subunit KhtT